VGYIAIPYSRNAVMRTLGRVPIQFAMHLCHLDSMRTPRWGCGPRHGQPCIQVIDVLGGKRSKLKRRCP
jgi:hypothetical protein